MAVFPLAVSKAHCILVAVLDLEQLLRIADFDADVAPLWTGASTDEPPLRMLLRFSGLAASICDRATSIGLPLALKHQARRKQ